MPALPDDVSLDLILRELELRAKLLRSLDEIDRGEGIPHEEVMEDLQGWLRSSGQERPGGTSRR